MARAQTYSPHARDAAQLLGIEIARARRARRWTIAELAERAGVSHVTVRSAETGALTVSIGTVFEIATILGIDLFAPADQMDTLLSRGRDRLALLPTRPSHAFVWAWLPGASEPVVAGRLDGQGEIVTFTYGRSYLAHPDTIALYLPELPLRAGAIRPGSGLSVAGCIKDAGPGSWGQRVILARRLGRLDRTSDTADLSLLTYLLESGSDRIGALDFQSSATEYVPRTGHATLGQMQAAADILQGGGDLPVELAEALLRGTSIGGARPKVLLDDADRKLIAKLSSTTDTYRSSRPRASL